MGLGRSGITAPLNLFTVPKSLRYDRQVALQLLEWYADSWAWQVVHHYPEETWIVPSSVHQSSGEEEEEDGDTSRSFSNSISVWEDADLFVAFLRGMASKEREIINGSIVRQVLGRFAFQLRNDATLLWQQVLQPLSSGRSFVPLLEALLSVCHQRDIGDNDSELHHQPLLLRNNKAFALQVADQEASQFFTPSTLKCFSKRLRDDEDVVRAVVRQSGMCLRQASYRLRKHARVVQTACDQDPRALVHCLHPFKRKLLVQGRSRVLPFFQKMQQAHGASAVAAAPADLSSHCQVTQMGRRVWKELSAKWKRDPDIARAALLSRSIAVTELAPELRTSRDFWKQMVLSFPAAWRALPAPFDRDVDLARVIPEFSSWDLYESVRSRFPELLAHDRNVWWNLVSSSPNVADSLNHIFQHEAPPAILNDKEIVVRACLTNPYVLEYLNFPLSEDRDVIAAALDGSAGEALDVIPDWVQAQYPDLVARAIREFDEDEEIWELFDSIDENLWSRPEVAHAWASRGGDYLHEEFPEEFEDDQELFLLLAEHNSADFWCASDKLTRNKDFMLKVVGINPNLIREASRKLSQDFEVALMAFGGGNGQKRAFERSRDLPGMFDISDGDDLEFLTNFAKEVRARLESHESFIRLLCGMSTKRSLGDDEASCPLRLLNQGGETTIAYKKLLAQYAGISMGRELRQLRRASTNLAVWGF